VPSLRKLYSNVAGEKACESRKSLARTFDFGRNQFQGGRKKGGASTRGSRSGSSTKTVLEMKWAVKKGYKFLSLGGERIKKEASSRRKRFSLRKSVVQPRQGETKPKEGRPDLRGNSRKVWGNAKEERGKFGKKRSLTQRKK